MVEPVSVALKFGFLAVLYLFLLWVARSVLRDLRRSTVTDDWAEAPPPDATAMHQASEGLAPDGVGHPRLVVERASGHDRGSTYDLDGGDVVLGRGDVEIQLDDPFASSQHARIQRQGMTMVIEDLGSTNGTYLNEEPLQGPQPLHPGDRIRIGDSEFTFQH
jgi:FHA domain